MKSGGNETTGTDDADFPVLPGNGSLTAVSAACRRLALRRPTLRRWGRWWQETFAGSAFCRAQRGRFRPGVEASGLPRSLRDGFRKSGLPGRAVRALSFLRDDFLFATFEGGAVGDRNPQMMHPA